MSVAIVENHGSAELQHTTATCSTPKNIHPALLIRSSSSTTRTRRVQVNEKRFS